MDQICLEPHPETCPQVGIAGIFKILQVVLQMTWDICFFMQTTQNPSIYLISLRKLLDNCPICLKICCAPGYEILSPLIGALASRIWLVKYYFWAQKFWGVVRVDKIDIVSIANIVTYKVIMHTLAIWPVWPPYENIFCPHKFDNFSRHMNTLLGIR